jgi:hypothetical protein
MMWVSSLATIRSAADAKKYWQRRADGVSLSKLPGLLRTGIRSLRIQQIHVLTPPTYSLTAEYIYMVEEGLIRCYRDVVQR